MKDGAFSAKPAAKPVPNFGSGPCKKRPGWSLAGLDDSLLGRSHRSTEGKALLAHAIDESKRLLELPEGYDVDTHFTPRYRPWQQRLAMVPDGDLFKGISAGLASVVTDEIETFNETGILTTVVGKGRMGRASVGLHALEAEFDTTTGVAVDAALWETIQGL